jgi:2-polyprenyl-3-methyl-5-hydroxy-6-metoxy-1,4-benzoquinol methylase
MNNITYNINTSTEEKINLHLTKCKDLFIPSLDSYVNINEYSKKLYNNSVRFEAYIEDELVGLIAVYDNKKENFSFITNVSVFTEVRNLGVANHLINLCKKETKNKTIKLEVNKDNLRAINFYKKHNFNQIGINNNNFIMEYIMERDYNQEFKDTADHKYAYNFDFDVMHPYMIKSFEPFFKGDDVLELGSFKGDFTKHLLPYFNNITCVEASDEAVNIAKEKFGDKITIYNSLFENTKLPKKYNNIILTHVLEHIDDPDKLIKQINDEWLSDDGYLFIVCPNANAPSRQIAVKMGLISHNTAVTPSEVEHGHRITYTLDTLERDAIKGGVKIIHRSGIFFKALANFQWDKLLQTDIISKEYLDGCFALGQQYPDLCSSILLICKKG